MWSAYNPLERERKSKSSMDKLNPDLTSINTGRGERWRTYHRVLYCVH